MKKIFTLLIGIVFSITIINAQDPVTGSPPEGFSYKATITKMLPNGNLAIVAQKTIGLMINIRQGTDYGTIVYSETFTPKTNSSGQIDIVIGLNPDPDYLFSLIPWSDDIFFLQVWVDINGGTAYGTNPMSITQLLSVPYALHTKTIADNAITSAKIVNATITSADLADNAVITSKINNEAVTGDKIAQAEATTGQALKWDGAKWSPGNDAIGTPGGKSGNVQFNNDGVLGGTPRLHWSDAYSELGIGGDLYVSGAVQIGYSGKPFYEIREVAGVTLADWNTTSVNYPPDFDMDNTRVLSVEIKLWGEVWATAGYSYGGSSYPISCIMYSDHILLIYPDDDAFHSKYYRILLMRVQKFILP
jgi:hypothetical protein